MQTIYLVYLIIALQVLDGLLTLTLIRRPGMTEGNPVAMKLFSLIGSKATIILVKLGLAIGFWIYRADFVLWQLLLINAWYIGIVVWNTRMLIIAKRNKT